MILYKKGEEKRRYEEQIKKVLQMKVQIKK